MTGGNSRRPATWRTNCGSATEASIRFYWGDVRQREGTEETRRPVTAASRGRLGRATSDLAMALPRGTPEPPVVKSEGGIEGTLVSPSGLPNTTDLLRRCVCSEEEDRRTRRESSERSCMYIGKGLLPDCPAGISISGDRRACPRGLLSLPCGSAADRRGRWADGRHRRESSAGTPCRGRWHRNCMLRGEAEGTYLV